MSCISDAERPKQMGEKSEPVVAGQEHDFEAGHLQELEVDLSEALNEGAKELDLDSDHSPYAEGMLGRVCAIGRELTGGSACRCPRSG